MTQIDLAGALTQRSNIIKALILRDLRTRFGRSHLGYLLAIAWPFTHLAVLVSIMAFVNRVAPIGGDPAVFVSTGVLPYILCLYPARMMGMVMDTSRPLFLFPVIKPFDIILSRAIIEFMTAFVVVIMLFLFAFFLNIDLTPNDSFTLVTGLLATIFLSLSIGFLNVAMGSLFKMWNIVFVMTTIAMYMSAGVFAAPSAISPTVAALMSYNPLFHSVEWIRSAYYEGYGDEWLSKGYLVGFAAACLLLGLLGERFLRGRLLLG